MKKTLKVLTSSALVALAMTSTAFAALSTAPTVDNGINIKINDGYLDFTGDVPPINESGRVLVPLRMIFEALNAEVVWDSETQSVFATGADGTLIKMTIDSTSYTVNGTEKTLDVPAKILNGRTLVPVRAVSESLACDVLWDGDNQTVLITEATTATPETATPEIVTPETPNEQKSRLLEAKLLELTNAERANAGIAPLAHSDHHQSYARMESAQLIHNDEIAYFEESNASGMITAMNSYAMNKLFVDTISDTETTALIEDIANNYITQWLASENHKAHILNPEYVSVGIGFACDFDNIGSSGSNQYLGYATQMYGK